MTPSTYCQLKCPPCPNKRLEGKGFLDIEDYKKLLDNDIQRVELGNWGEPFLYPDMLELLVYSAGRVKLGALTNLNYITDEVIDGLVRYGVERLVISLDGASQGTYEKYRVGGDITKVFLNIEKINNTKRRFRSKFPELVWQFLVFGHNEHEIGLARAGANSLGMSFALALPTEMDFNAPGYDCDFSPVRDHERVRKELGFASLEEQREKAGVFRDFGVCNNLWDEPAINWDGRVFGCCGSTQNFGGNAFTDGFVPSVNNEVIGYAREMVRGRVPPREDVPCSNCLFYRMMGEYGTWLSR